MAVLKKESNISSKPKLSRRSLRKLVSDAYASAEAANLRYVGDAEPGFRRIRNGKSFYYELNGKTVSDPDSIARINNLVLPPAWENVWICKDPDGHLQATGVDAKGRKQYRYHHAWNALRSQTKFYHLSEFGRALPAIRSCIEKHLALPRLPEEKVLAALVSIMQETGIRIGNAAYEKMNGSFGLSTLKDRHVRISGSELKFSFRGKKGVAQKLSIKSRKLASIVRKCRDIPGDELFQYVDGSGAHYPIDSGRLNAYIKDISGGHFSAKDFRTWTGSLTALQAFRELGCGYSSKTESNQKINSALDKVAAHLGNTRTVCRKYYVHPAILDLYECSKLERHLRELDAQPDVKGNGLTKEEEVLMKILEQS